MVNISQIIKNLKNIIYDSESQDFSLSHLPDPLLEKVKGSSMREKLSRDAMDLALEVNGITRALFPVLTKPASPGYVTYDHDYFEMLHRGTRIKKDMGDYFLEERFPKRDGIYGNATNLAQLFEFVVRDLLVDGKSYLGIDWQAVKINNKEYILPAEFYYLNNVTVFEVIEENTIKGYKQNYSFWTRLLSPYFHYRNRSLSLNQVLAFKYPFKDVSPVTSSLRSLKRVKKFWAFSLNQSEASTKTLDHSLRFERTRYKTYKKEKRAYDLARARIRKEFNYLYEDVSLTSYFDIYTVANYLMSLNNLREYLITTFNSQVMGQVALKNNLKQVPTISMREGIVMSNDSIKKYFEKFKKGEITNQDFIDKVIKSK